MQAIKAYTQIFEDLNCKKPLEKIELIGRTCYKSEDKITEESAPRFVENLIIRGHEAMLEHATFIFEVDWGVYRDILDSKYYFETKLGHEKMHLRFTNFIYEFDRRTVVSGNVRAWRDYINAHLTSYSCVKSYMKDFIEKYQVLFPEIQLSLLGEEGEDVRIYRDNGFDAKFKQITVDDLTDREKLVHCDLTVKFVTDRGISHEIVRHRIASFAQESTRYCNYTKDQFNNELTFIIPDFLEYGSEGFKIWREQMKQAEKTYFAMIAAGHTPQEARDVLPTSIKTELIMTANLNEWRHFFKLRAANQTGKVHPQMLEITQPLLDDVKKLIPIVFDDINY